MILGITGKSGSGKHTAANFLEQKGWEVLDADKIAHHLYRPYTRVWKKITKYFGEDILTGKDVIDRQKLGEIVFKKGNEEKLQALNSFVHPEIKRHIKDEIYYFNKKKRDAVVIGALWEELELFSLCDKVILVTANEQLAFERVKKRDGITREMYEIRVGRQSHPNKPDFIINNEDKFQEFYKELNTLPIY